MLSERCFQLVKSDNASVALVESLVEQRKDALRELSLYVEVTKSRTNLVEI